MDAGYYTETMGSVVCSNSFKYIFIYNTINKIKREIKVLLHWNNEENAHTLGYRATGLSQTSWEGGGETDGGHGVMTCSVTTDDC